jgi:hypothetical protein
MFFYRTFHFTVLKIGSMIIDFLIVDVTSKNIIVYIIE